MVALPYSQVTARTLAEGSVVLCVCASVQLRELNPAAAAIDAQSCLHSRGWWRNVLPVFPRFDISDGPLGSRPIIPRNACLLQTLKLLWCQLSLNSKWGGGIR